MPRLGSLVQAAVRSLYVSAQQRMIDQNDDDAQPQMPWLGLFRPDLVVGTFGDNTLVGRTPPDLDDLSLGTSDRILGLPGNDTIYGNLGQDTLAGGSGDDVILTGAPPDTELSPIPDMLGDVILGGAGNDDIRGSFGDDTIFGGKGDDVIWGEPIQAAPGSPGGNDTIHGGQGDDTIDGGVGDEVIYGETGDDAVFGSVGNETMFGGQGDDFIYGGQGDDVIVGGRGADSFVFFDAFASPGAGVVTNGDDVILDFGAGDRLLTQSALDDPDEDGIIPLSPDSVIELPSGPTQFIPGGTVTLVGVSGLFLVGEELIGDTSYFVYEIL